MSDMYRPAVTDTEADDAVFALILTLRQQYSPRPTAWDGLDASASQIMTAQWMQTLSPYETDHVAEAMTLHMDGPHGQFFPALNDLVALCEQVRRDREAGRMQEAVRASSGVCDGSGWVMDANGTRFPCGRCNPVLRMVYNDRRKWAKFLTGAPLASLGVGVERTAGVLRSDTPMPDKCTGPEDGDMLPPHRTKVLKMAAMHVMKDDAWKTEMGLPALHNHGEGIDACPRCGDLMFDMLWPLAVAEAERRVM